MEYVKAETIAAIQRDEFARAAIEATRKFVYAHFRDWGTISRTGAVPFTDENAATAYNAMSALLGVAPADVPNLESVTVNIGGVEISTGALEGLQDAFRRPLNPEGSTRPQLAVTPDSDDTGEPGDA